MTKGGPTKRAADGGESPTKMADFYTLNFSAFRLFSTLARVRR